MGVVVATIGILIASLGALGVASPERLLALVASLATPRGLWVAAIVRIALGASLWLAADDSRAPAFLRIVGSVALVAGVVTPFVGVEATRELLAWWRRRSLGVVRLSCALVVLLGLSLLWAAG